MTPELTTEQKQRRARKSMPKPMQLGLFEPPRTPPLPITLSAAALAIAADVDMRNQAERILAAKGGKPAIKAPKPKPRVLTS